MLHCDHIHLMQGWWREKWYHSPVHALEPELVSPSLLSLLWSQRVCINTWLHTEGLSQTCLVLGTSLSATTKNSLSRKRWDLHKRGTKSQEQERYRTHVSCSSLFKCLWRFGILLWLDCDCCEWISWAHITTVHPHVVTYLFKFVFTSLFPLLHVTYLFSSYGNCRWFTLQLWNSNHCLNQKISISVFDNPTYEIHIAAQHQTEFVLMMSCSHGHQQQYSQFSWHILIAFYC